MSDAGPPQPVANRRAFVRRLALAPVALSLAVRGADTGGQPRRVRFGLIADIHPDVMPDRASICIRRSWTGG
jgi:hypothetical protein